MNIWSVSAQLDQKIGRNTFIGTPYWYLLLVVIIAIHEKINKKYAKFIEHKKWKYIVTKYVLNAYDSTFSYYAIKSIEANSNI